MRKEKDARIMHLEQEKEEQRESYERRIIELESHIKCTFFLIFNHHHRTAKIDFDLELDNY